MVDVFEEGKTYRLVDDEGYEFNVTEDVTVTKVGDTFTCGITNRWGTVCDKTGNPMVADDEYHCFELVEEDETPPEPEYGRWVSTTWRLSIDNAWDKPKVWFIVGKTSDGRWYIHDEEFENGVLPEDHFTNKCVKWEYHEIDTRTEFEKKVDQMVEKYKIEPDIAKQIVKNELKISEEQ